MEIQVALAERQRFVDARPGAPEYDDQGQAKSFGFINPLLYTLGSDAYHPTLPVSSSTPMLDRSAFTPPGVFGFSGVSVFDDQNPLQTDQVTAPGYDTMTGLGTPKGSAFIAALRAGS